MTKLLLLLLLIFALAALVGVCTHISAWSLFSRCAGRLQAGVYSGFLYYEELQVSDGECAAEAAAAAYLALVALVSKCNPVLLCSSHAALVVAESCLKSMRAHCKPT